MGLPCRTCKEVLAQKIDLFPKRQKADLLVAITPRQIVHNFLTDYFCHHWKIAGYSAATSATP